MLSLPLLKQNIKEYWKSWAFFTIILLLFTVFTILFYSPDGQGILYRLTDTFPKELMDGLAIKLQDSSLTGYISSYLFGFIYLIVPMIFEIITADKLIAGKVDNQFMSYLLSGMSGRKSIVLTQAYYLGTSVFLMLLATAAAGGAACMVNRKGSLEVLTYILMFVGLLCLHLCISGFCFLVSAVCDKSRTYMMIGAGLPILFYTLHMLANMADDLFVLKFLSIFTLFDPWEIIEGSISTYWKLPLLAVAGLIFFRLGMGIFRKRDLPL